MKKLLIGLGCLVLAGCSSAPTEPVKTTVQVGDREFLVEVADTPELRAEGLMHRTEVPTGTGMLFVFEEPQPVSFWMKNTLVPLDIAWITSDGVVAGVTRIKPCPPEAAKCPQYRSPAPVLWTLEAPAGELAGAVGDQIIFSNSN